MYFVELIAWLKCILKSFSKRTCTQVTLLSEFCDSAVILYKLTTTKYIKRIKHKEKQLIVYEN